MFDPGDCAKRLEVQGARILDIYRNVAEDDLRWRPQPDKWSLIEVLGHLVDEEKQDFRARIREVLAGEDLAPIDPAGWVVERKHQEANFDALLTEFERERRDSLHYLLTLRDVDWNQAHVHPEFGPLHAGDLLVAWVRHDLLHLTQIHRIQAFRIFSLSSPYDPTYAG